MATINSSKRPFPSDPSPSSPSCSPSSVVKSKLSNGSSAPTKRTKLDTHIDDFFSSDTLIDELEAVEEEEELMKGAKSHTHPLRPLLPVLPRMVAVVVVV